MPTFISYWHEENEEHLAQHGISREEFQEVVENPERQDVSESSGRTIVWGWTSTGKYIVCIYDEVDELHIEPVTAYEVED